MRSNLPIRHCRKRWAVVDSVVHTAVEVLMVQFSFKTKAISMIYLHQPLREH